MQGSIPVARRNLVERIATSAASRTKRIGRIDVAKFVAAYYRGVAVEDLKARDTKDLAGAALEHLRFAQSRKRATPAVRVYSPDVKRNGFRSNHTVVEVTTSDMPFLVDSLNIVFAQQGLDVHLTVHPVLAVRRSRGGQLVALLDKREVTGLAESWQHIEIDRLPDEASCERLRQELLKVLDDVQRACNDWPAMRDRAREIAGELRSLRHKALIGNANECADLMDWLADNHFTFLGYREFTLRRDDEHDLLEPLSGTSLGILRKGVNRANAARAVELTGALRTQARAPEILFVTKANTLSTVHRGTYLDYVGVKRFDPKGNVIGERRFLGLFTSTVYQSTPREIPVLRDKVKQVIDRFGLAPDSHDGKAVAHVLDTYPRDELFQASIDDLVESVRGIVNLYERAHVRLFIRRDRFQRYYSCLLFVPRDRYSTVVRQRIEAIVLDVMRGTAVESQIQLSDSALARVHMLVRSRADSHDPIDVAALEARIADTVRTWFDHLRDALVEKYDEPQGLSIAKQLASAFPAAYQEDVSIADALIDIDQLLQILDSGDGQALRLITNDQHWHIRLLRAGAPLSLSDALPLLENLGLRVLTERPYSISVSGKRETWVQDFEVDAPKNSDAADTVSTLFRDAYFAIDSGRAENDGFNRLLLAAGLPWRSITLLRALARYLLQTGFPFSQAYIERTLQTHATITRELWKLFATSFDPAANRKRDAEIKATEEGILRLLEAVATQDEDRILRAYLNVIRAMLRTNFYQRDGGTYKPYVSFKIDSQRIPDLPLPKPYVEVFVYSPRVEGIHLRMGKVARGGIRWSDRREDFRTEILGLMKAQNVKNTVIVPVGAKGGFVPKRIPPNASSDDRQREGIECYRTFIRGLLDITDNSIGGKIIPPLDVVRHDDDDPYLVVAADKGTASFSDIANSISAEYKFWLGDAFASGGSAGYDHKKMAITARGAWECVKRHFRELGVDTQTQDFTVIGIGDMSGDVFGNGMLRSNHIRLLAAFDHRHIFIDPNPDAATSFAERERMFGLSRSSWEDYDTKLISAGGGVFSRNTKSIKLTPQIKSLLQIEDDVLTPQALIRAILRMPVDLLWNGGIGTYVKASYESHAQVGDRTNDVVRVDGRELRCKVFGEGGNLGCTQLGRIEYTRHGGRINTDFIDNSAGVDCSDHEVNIKILLNAAKDKGLTVKERNKLLVQMTDDVAALVLRDNYLQSQALSMVELAAKLRLPEHEHFIRSLEITGELDRTVEFLPSSETIAQRAKQGEGLSRPELAVLLSYSKIALFNRLIGTDVPEDPYLGQELERYFPAVLQARYRGLMSKHRLRREIITTAITNSLVNRMGPSFALRAQEDTGADAATIARAYTIARECIEARELWNQIEALDNVVPASVQYALMNEIARLLRFITYWLITRHRKELLIEKQVNSLRPGIRQLRKDSKSVLSGETLTEYREQQSNYLAQHLTPKLAEQMAGIEALYSAPDIVEIATLAKQSVAHVGTIYFQLDNLLSLNWLRDQVQSLTAQDRWQAVARTTLRDNLYALHRTLCLQIVRLDKRADALQTWRSSNAVAIEHAVQSLKEMRALARIDFATLSVAMQSLRQIAD